VTESLEVGNLADFACLSGDSLSVPEDEIKDIVPKFTVLDCKIVYQGTDA
jgi:predicted amidohydrolase YtcJ